jgi:Ras-related protein Rab-18
MNEYILQEFSRQVSTSEGQAFATRMSSLFIEASAKTSVGVREAFQEVVEQILDTPELWAPVTPDLKGASASASGKKADGEVPGTINLEKAEEYSGCSC